MGTVVIWLLVSFGYARNNSYVASPIYEYQSEVVCEGSKTMLIERGNRHLALECIPLIKEVHKDNTIFSKGATDAL